MFTLPNNFASLYAHYSIDQLHYFFGGQSWNLGHMDWVLVPYGNKEINSKEKEFEPSRCGD
jgi:hypothetical protein